ncbi:DUF5667 domain-containing protein [Streptomyces sp. ODS28]|uniref:DUF5667 domain-containing protein n=1 Tax=Streptomyces sp. ODS28 TaxID=3136688 RepID=UPI0031EECFA6
MIGSVSASRRANAFAQVLDEQRLDDAAAAEQTAGDGAGATPPEYAQDAGGGEEQLLRLVDGLEALPKPELDPEVKTVQRAQLVAAMEAAFAEGAAAGPGDRVPEQRARPGKGSHRAPSLGPLGKLRPKSRLAKGLTAGGLGVGVAATALGGVAAASTDALPGDHLYGFKRGMEDLKLDMAGDEADRGRLYLDNASTRLGEARRLLEHRRGGAELGHEQLGEVRRTLSGMRHDADEGHRLLSAAYERDGDLGPMQSLSSFSRGHRAGWSELRDRLPVQLTDVGEEVSSVFDAIDEEVGPLEDMFPKAPGSPPHKAPEDTPRTQQSEPGSASPSSPDASAPESSDGRTGEGSGSPSPSESRSKKPDQGLLGGGGGLLGDPSQDAKKPSEPESDSPAPDVGKDGVDLRPIVPDVLPGLKDLPPKPPQ